MTDRTPPPAEPGDEPAGSAAPRGDDASGAAPRVERVSTPADATPLPEPGDDGLFDLDDPRLYLNRELTWLNFNFRVLREAQDERTPLLERVRFLSIVGSNLDEFFMKRIGGLKQQIGAGLLERTVDGRTPADQVRDSHALIRELESRLRQAFLQLQESLGGVGVRMVPFDELEDADQEWLRQHFIDNVYPLVTPQATDPAHPFPFISNLSLNLLVTLRYDETAAPALARVKVPVGPGIPRMVRLRDTTTYVRLESIMAGNLDLLFPGMTIDGWSTFRVTRNANTEKDEEHADDLLSLIESELRDRKFAPVVRLEVERDMPAGQRGLLTTTLGLDESADVFEVDGMLGMRDLSELVDVDIPGHAADELRHAPHHPVDHPELRTSRNIFHIVRDEKSLLLHHPYQSFSTSVERFLREASRDPKVRAIKMCLYRTSQDTQAIHYLIEAARNGKQVAVVVELKARFDEAANIRWAADMEEAGIHVTYGVVGLKTHCKVILVVRQDHDGLRRYAHIGTGNYHAGTARLYGDVGMITSDKQIGADLTELLNYLTTGYKPKRHYGKLVPAPKLLRQTLLRKIQREVDHVAAGERGLIQLKMNALEDPEITRALYAASQAGVHVDLIVRDTCRLRPGIPRLSQNVRVISIVGRFLEHARISYFRNGGDEEYWIGSADCMKRNLDSRVEVLAPIEKATHKEALRRFLDLQLQDERHAWEMSSDGSYRQRVPSKPKRERGSQQLLVEWHEKLDKASGKKRRKLRIRR